MSCLDGGIGDLTDTQAHWEALQMSCSQTLRNLMGGEASGGLQMEGFVSRNGGALSVL